jgi:hypothetical protein
VDTQGDAFFVAFARASDALAAASAGREALAGGPIRVRMGLHTGKPTVTEEGYVGIDVHRAARIAAAGHGGQVLVSRSTRDLSDSAELRDLGEHRLKDLAAPERIYQLGDSDFAPLKSLNATNLPIAGNRLVGRERELAELQELLSGPARLVTVTGPGGTGKTRLTLQVGAELVDKFPGGVFFVALAGVRQPELVSSTIATTVGVHDLSELRDRDALLVIDNFEHVLGAQPALELRRAHRSLLRAADRTKARPRSRDWCFQPSLVSRSCSFRSPLALIRSPSSSSPSRWRVRRVLYTVSTVSLLQALTPPRLLGRANASRRFVVWGTIPLGGLASGGLASWFGLRPTLFVGTLGCALSAIPILLSPIRHLTALPTQSEETGSSSV